jgi:hypothetical protein
MEAAKLDYEPPARESLLNVVLDKLTKAGKVGAWHVCFGIYI